MGCRHAAPAPLDPLYLQLNSKVSLMKPWTICFYYPDGTSPSRVQWYFFEKRDFLIIIMDSECSGISLPRLFDFTYSPRKTPCFINYAAIISISSHTRNKKKKIRYSPLKYLYFKFRWCVISSVDENSTEEALTLLIVFKCYLIRRVLSAKLMASKEYEPVRCKITQNTI